MTKRTVRSRAVRLIGAIVPAGFLYPLSIGAVAFLVGAGALGDQSVDATRTIYRPLNPLLKTGAGNVIWYLQDRGHKLGRRRHG
jgi:hypothetical protein